MARALGVGGVFFRSENPEALAAWYKDRLGIGAGEHGTWDTDAGMTLFSPFKADTDYFPADRRWMVNFRVDDLDGLIARFREAGEEVETRAEWETPYGRFARVHDPEGNPIELWQAPAGDGEAA